MELVTSQLQVQPIENYILPYKLGQARLVQGSHHFIYKIKGQDLFQNVLMLKKQIGYINTTYATKMSPNGKTTYTYMDNMHESDQSIYDLIQQTAQNIHQTELKFQNIFPDYLRKRRSPLNIVGNAASWLFAIMDNEEKENRYYIGNIRRKSTEPT